MSSYVDCKIPKDLYTLKDYSMSILYSKYYLHKDIEEIKGPMLSLANRGFAKALAFYCSLRKTMDVFELFESTIRYFLNKPEKTPEDWLVCAAYFKNEKNFFGEGLEWNVRGREDWDVEGVQKIIKNDFNRYLLGEVSFEGGLNHLYYKYQDFFDSKYFIALQYAKNGFLERAINLKRQGRFDQAFNDECQWMYLNYFPNTLSIRKIDSKHVETKLEEVNTYFEKLKQDYKTYYEDYPELSFQQYHYAKLMSQRGNILEKAKAVNILEGFARQKLPVDYSQLTTADRIFNNKSFEI